MNAVNEIRQILDEAEEVHVSATKENYTLISLTPRDIEQINEYLAEIEDYHIRLEADLSELERQLDYEELAS